MFSTRIVKTFCCAFCCGGVDAAAAADVGLCCGGVDAAAAVDVRLGLRECPGLRPAAPTDTARLADAPRAAMVAD